MDLLVAKWRAKNKSYVSQKRNHAWKNAQLRRTLQKLVKIPNASKGSFSSKIRGF